jgi:hypothetical protein
MSLPRNRLHVLANDVEISALPIAEFGSNGEHLSGVAETKARLVHKTNGEAERSVIDGMGDEVHDLAVGFGILFISREEIHVSI